MLEVLETPPPAARMVQYVIIAFFVVALTWSILGRLDENSLLPAK